MLHAATNYRQWTADTLKNKSATEVGCRRYQTPRALLLKGKSTFNEPGADNDVSMVTLSRIKVF